MTRSFTLQTSLRTAWLSGAAWACLLAPAFAQSPAVGAPKSTAGAAPVAGLEEVVVTARRVEENLQRVPLAVTAVTASQMQTADVRTQYEVLRFTPGIQTALPNLGNQGIITYQAVRGVRSVANYFADTPSGEFIYNSPFFDAANVQVLRGPQGTLFGQASNAGAELVEPHMPGNSLGGYIEATAGTYGRRSVEGAIDLPLAGDKVVARIAGQTFARNGFIKDIISNYAVANEDYQIFRPILVVRPTDNLQIDTIYQYHIARHLGQQKGVLMDFNMSPASQIPIVTQQAALNGMTVAQFYQVRDQMLAEQERLGPYRFDGWSIGCPASAYSPATRSTVPGPNVDSVIPQACPPDGRTDVRNNLISRIKWSLGDHLTVKNMASYTWSKNNGLVLEGDMTRLILREDNPRSKAPDFTAGPKVWSEEFQLSGSNLGPLSSFVTGVFTTASLSRPDFKYPAFTAYSTSLTDSAATSKTSRRESGVYGQATSDLSPLVRGLRFTYGARYSWESANSLSFALNPTTFAITRVVGGRGTPNGEAHWQGFTYNASLEYQATPDTLLFLTNSKGRSAGSLQNIAGIEKVNPDSLNNLEGGVKTTFSSGDWRFRLNASAYYGWFSNVQVISTSLGTSTVTGAVTYIVGTQNAADARIAGAEAEFAAGNKDWNISGFVSYASAHYVHYPSINTLTQKPEDLTDTPFISMPPWKFGIRASYRLPVSNAEVGDISVRAAFTYDAQFWSNVTKPRTPDDPNNPNTGLQCYVLRTTANGYNLSADGGKSWRHCAPERHILDLSANWSDFLGHKDLDLTFSVSNVLNFSEWYGISRYSDPAAMEVGTPQPPRMFYLTVTQRF